MVKAYTDRIKGVEDRMMSTENGMKDMGRRMEKMEDRMDSRDDKIEKRRQRGEDEVFEELREREARRANIVMYKVEEHREEKATGVERQEWDRKMCRKIFEALELDMKGVM